jgi:hypothetical protein
MKEIKTISDFEQCIHAENAIIFIFFAWSGRSHESRKIALSFETEWSNKLQLLDFDIWELEPEKNEFSLKWVYEEVKDLFGYGSFVWLRNGKILGFEKNVALADIKELKEKTKLLFSES